MVQPAKYSKTAAKMSDEGMTDVDLGPAEDPLTLMGAVSRAPPPPLPTTRAPPPPPPDSPDTMRRKALGGGPKPPPKAAPQPDT